METLEKLEELLVIENADYKKGVLDCIKIIKKGDNKALRSLINCADDEDFRDAFKGNRLIGYLNKRYIVIKIKLGTPHF